MRWPKIIWDYCLLKELVIKQTILKPWYKKSANQNLSEASSNLAKVYVKGFGVQKNIPEAVKWYNKAADGGDLEANNALISLKLKAQSNQVENTHIISSELVL